MIGTRSGYETGNGQCGVDYGNGNRNQMLGVYKCS